MAGADRGLDQRIKQGMESKLVGSEVPDVPLYRLDAGSTEPTELRPKDLFKGKLAVLVGVPGAFTPVCSSSHVPDYVKHWGELRKEGVECVAVTSVNDAYVMQAWGKDLGAQGKLDLLADPDAAFAKALNAAFEGSDKFKGPRSRRYSAVLQNGLIETFNLEREPNDLDVSSAEVALGQIAALRNAGAIQQRKDHALTKEGRAQVRHGE